MKVLGTVVCQLNPGEGIEDQAGTETIKAFIQRAKKNGVVSQDVQKVLKEISGKNFSTTINLKDALRELEE